MRTGYTIVTLTGAEKQEIIKMGGKTNKINERDI